MVSVYGFLKSGHTSMGSIIRIVLDFSNASMYSGSVVFTETICFKYFVTGLVILAKSFINLSSYPK